MSSEKPNIAAHASGDVVWIDMMSLPKGERGKGAGRAGYAEWEETLPENITRVQILASDTGAGNSAAFWEKMGFTYQYEGENLDYESAHRMWKGVNGHATPPTVNVDDEDEEERLAESAVAGSETMKDTPIDAVASPAFERWFSGSRVVDTAGEPLVVYHGTMANFTVFHDGEDGGTYFSPSKATAEFFSENNDRGWDDQVEPRVVDAYLSIKNPLVLNDAQLSELIGDPDDRDWTAMPSVIDDARQAGHDGLHLVDVTGDTPQESGDQWVAFSPNQIKSASANSGGFDPEDPDYTDQKFLAASNAQKAIDWLQEAPSKKAAPHA